MSLLFKPLCLWVLRSLCSLLFRVAGSGCFPTPPSSVLRVGACWNSLGAQHHRGLGARFTHCDFLVLLVCIEKICFWESKSSLQLLFSCSNALIRSGSPLSVAVQLFLKYPSSALQPVASFVLSVLLLPSFCFVAFPVHPFFSLLVSRPFPVSVFGCVHSRVCFVFLFPSPSPYSASRYLRVHLDVGFVVQNCV